MPCFNWLLAGERGKVSLATTCVIMMQKLQAIAAIALSPAACFSPELRPRARCQSSLEEERNPVMSPSAASRVGIARPRRSPSIGWKKAK
jgi:hypothetical protein